MNVRIYQIILLFFTLNTYVNSSDYTSSLVKRSDGSKIDYYLFEESPDRHSKVLLLLLHGSDCNSVLKIESIFTDYQNVWPTADLLLIEKYGIDEKLDYDSFDAERKGCPLEYITKDSPEQRVMDIKIVLETVRKKTKYEKIIVIGGSEGAVIANLLAASVGYVDATISFNGGGRWFVDDVLHNMALEIEDEEEKKQSIQGFKGFSEQVLQSELFDLEVSGHGYRWWHQMLSIDQYSILREVTSPLLIVQGGIDLSVSPKKVDDMILALRESGNKHIEYFTYAKLDHGFNNSTGQSERKKVIADMNAWLKTVLYSPNKSIQPIPNAAVD